MTPLEKLSTLLQEKGHTVSFLFPGHLTVDDMHIQCEVRYDLEECLAIGRWPKRVNFQRYKDGNYNWPNVLKRIQKLVEEEKAIRAQEALEAERWRAANNALDRLQKDFDFNKGFGAASTNVNTSVEGINIHLHGLSEEQARVALDALIKAGVNLT